ncbi:MAG: hypothetical protein GY856_54690 [bacterium]|nr:hypothetical protein [bacterium]
MERNERGSQLAAAVVAMAVLSGIPASPQGQEGQPAHKADQLTAIPFETIPADTQLRSSGGIILDGAVETNGSLAVHGVVESQLGGIKFPDATVQATASNSAFLSANTGLYHNRVADVTPLLPYSEICFKEGSIFVDIHSISEPTTGGLCDPGDVGWLMERDERPDTTWEFAKAECLMNGMRLPEPFEFKYSCKNSASFGLSDMIGPGEWSSNSAQQVVFDGGVNGLGVSIMGEYSCAQGGVGLVIYNQNPSEDSRNFRCVR